MALLILVLLCAVPAAAQSPFSHVAHLDPKARIDPQTGFRADCTFCHRFDRAGVLATMPTQLQCDGCHNRPGFTHQQLTAPANVTQYSGIIFSHASHFRQKLGWKIQCTTCHSTDGSLPQMIDCVGCHDQSRQMPAGAQMSNCRTCHADSREGPLPSDHTRNVKPAFHTEAFRIHHEAQAAAADAKCFACHQNLTPHAEARSQCVACHEVMRPASHTARWKDDLHGKYAALDRAECATCHRQDYCSRCHNELPRSHYPLPIFKNGAHAMPAMLDQRACMTCHTFQSTCASCHVNQLSPTVMKKN
jgi:hypothetical protein